MRERLGQVTIQFDNGEVGSVERVMLYSPENVDEQAFVRLGLVEGRLLTDTMGAANNARTYDDGVNTFVVVNLAKVDKFRRELSKMGIPLKK